MKRVLTAIVALPLLLYTVWSASPYFFVALIVVAVLLGLHEFYELASKVGCNPQVAGGYIASLAVLASFVVARPALTVAALAAVALCSLGLALRVPIENKSLAGAAATVFGVIYVGLLAGYMIAVRVANDSAGRISTPHFASKLLTMFFAVVMMTDTGAYYVGRAIGRHKLAPRISPGKTVEGSVGGFIMAIIAGVACKKLFLDEIPITHALVLSAAIGIVGQIGDLAESLLKRGAGVKDSGNLLPGHGGMLDRVDSILFCAPLLYYYVRILESGL